MNCYLLADISWILSAWLRKKFSNLRQCATRKFCWYFIDNIVNILLYKWIALFISIGYHVFLYLLNRFIRWLTSLNNYFRLLRWKAVYHSRILRMISYERVSRSENKWSEARFYARSNLFLHLYEVIRSVRSSLVNFLSWSR